MRKIIVMLLGSLLFCGCLKNENKEFVKVEIDQGIIVHGRPEKVTYFPYKPVEDENGNITKGELINKTIPNYFISEGFVLRFNKEGKHIQTNIYRMGDTLHYLLKKWEYLKNNQRKYTSYYPPYEEVDDMSIEKFDDSGNLIYESSYCPPCFDKNIKIKPSIEKFYSYDEKESLINKKRYTYDYGLYNDQAGKITDSLITHFTPEYKNGKLYKNGGIKYIYEEDNLLKKIFEETGMYEEYYPNGMIKKSALRENSYFEYNLDGYRIVRKFSKKHYVRNEYDRIDEYGNWTRVIIRENGKPVIYGERTIKYYN
ncbi:hypothetical protein [uncultured Maribacter sp.]|uniref:hypothetical protein n=1 Tax=uncultured Maribacter sp. TaxID=431308 RepID=UPI00261B4B00|nr:hypothetical protein [uncultured Maribacter sp.]